MEETTEYRVFVGIDWATTMHEVWAADAVGRLLGERQVRHTGEALRELADWLVGLADGDPRAVAVALEVPHGPIVDTLLDRGCHVFAINPRQLDRFRDRFSPSGAKDDRRDSRVLSSAVRTDRVALRQVHVANAATIQLREASRHDAELLEDSQRLANRLRDHLLRIWPELLALCPAADDPWFWSLLELAPTPAIGATVRPARVSHVLRAHRIRRVTAAQVAQVLRTPSVHVAPGVREGVTPRLLDLIAQLRVVSAQRRHAAARLQTLLTAVVEDTPAEQGREHHDATILQSLPGIGVRVVATMFAEAAGLLHNRDYHALRVLGGTAPVTKRSGKHGFVRMRYACSGRLRQALYCFGMNSLRRDPHTRAHYDALRARGHGHARALRGVVDRLLGVLVSMLRSGQLYDMSRRTAETLS